MTPITGPGVWLDMPEADYHADPCLAAGTPSLSSTTRRKYTPPTPAAIARAAIERREHKDAYDLGSVTHGLTLGRGCDIVEVTAPNWETKAAQRARATARARGAVALLTHQLATARRMADAVLNDNDAAAVLRRLPGSPEAVAVWDEETPTEGTIRCRAMFDRYPFPDVPHVPIIGDLKTARDVSDDAIARAVWEHGYHQQADHYERGYRALHGITPLFLFVFVLVDYPHSVRVVDLNSPLRRIASDLNDQAGDVWARCHRDKEWPGYPPGLLTIGPPRWARTEDYAA